MPPAVADDRTAGLLHYFLSLDLPLRQQAFAAFKGPLQVRVARFFTCIKLL